MTLSIALHAFLLTIARNAVANTAKQITSLSECNSTVSNFIVTNSSSSPFYDKSIIFGGSKELASHVAPNFFYRYSLRDFVLKTSGKGMVEIAKNKFVYEVPNPVIRYWLYMVGIADTTVLPFDLAQRAMSKSNTSLIRIIIRPSLQHRIQYATSSEITLLETSFKELNEYMRNNYSRSDYSSRTCI